MYRTLVDNTPLRSPRKNYIGMNRIRLQLSENVDKLIKHYNNSGCRLDGSHILVSLVNSFTVDHSTTDFQFRYAIEDITPALCMSHNIVASTNSTVRPSKGWLYGLTDSEYYVSVDFGISTSSIRRDWRKCTPLRVLRHTMTDLACQYPKGDVKGATDGIAVFLLDIPALAVMYKCWLEEQTTETSERVDQFLACYVLPNMLPSQVNVAWFNRLFALTNRAPVSSIKNAHSVTTPLDYNGIDSLLYTLDIDNKAVNASFNELLRNIPVPFGSTLLYNLQLPNILINRQCQWVMEIAYIPYVSYCLQVDQILGSTANLDERNALKRLMLAIRSENMIEKVPYSQRQAVKLDLQSNISIYL